VLSPEHRNATLWQPGSCLVVRATRPGQLFVEVVPIDSGGSTAATVKIETLSQGEVVVPVRRNVTARAVVDLDSSEDSNQLSLLGHVAGIGDVVARADEWIAGPASPARIEGVSIEWPGKPEDLDMRYSVMLARPHTTSGRTVELGGYAGTRGRALPVVGLSLELSGPGASDFQLVAEAAFLGAPVSQMIGRRLNLAGPTGREPLVGLRLRVDEINVPLQPLSEPVTTKTRSPGRVRVFRSQAAQGQRRSINERAAG
jgi:hypothetical protein